jgi:hypothetical protein
MSHAAFANKNAATPASKAAAKNASGNLRIGAANDYFEQEADRVADEVMADGTAPREWSLSRMGLDAPLQRKCSCGGSGKATGDCEECKDKEKDAATLQRQAMGVRTPGEVPQIVHDVLDSPGQPLDHNTREAMERRFGHDFARVRIHTDAIAAESARAVDALAYTVGHHIAFASGRYAPQTREGSHLIAHELAHNIQQRQASFRNLRIAQDGVAEREAQQAANSEPAAKRVLARPGQPAGLARQDAGKPIEVPLPKVEEPEDPFKDLGHSKAVRSKGTTWGWGAPETNNLYHECDIAPMEREAFKKFVKTLPPVARRGHRKPPGADEIMGVTTFNPGNAVPPEIATTTVQEDGKTAYKLKPTHAEMPPIRAAYTQEGQYEEGVVHDVTPECRFENIRTGGGSPIHWILTAGGAKKVWAGEQEHCDDIRAAFDLTLALYASAINNVAASERTYSKPEEAIKDATQAAGVAPDMMIDKFADAAGRTALRDDRDWHTAKIIGDKVHKDRPQKVGCKYYYTIDETSWPGIGTHPSSEVIAPAPVAKSANPTRPSGQKP